MKVKKKIILKVVNNKKWEFDKNFVLTNQHYIPGMTLI